MKLTDKQVNALLPQVKKVIVCDLLKYVETKVFDIDGKSVYHIFAAYNRKLNVNQKVTYSPTDNTVVFALHLLTDFLEK